MSLGEEGDLIDLFEYDEFDSYNEYAYHVVTMNNDSSNDGIPLSVELSETLNKSQSTINEKSSNDFVKAPEIFLRIDVNGAGPNSESFNKKNVECCEKLDSLESCDSNDVILTGNCAELQYENEFMNTSEPECNFSHSTRSIDNDYEELFLEGIINKVFTNHVTYIYAEIAMKICHSYILLQYVINNVSLDLK